MAGERTEGESPNTSSQTDQAGSPAQAETGGEVAEALARVQEAVINVKEGGLPEALEAAIEAIDSAVGEVPDKPEADQLNAVADALEGALEEVEKGKVANLLPVLEQAQSKSNPTLLRILAGKQIRPDGDALWYNNARSNPEPAKWGSEQGSRTLR
jgi:hypothetical protein